MAKRTDMAGLEASDQRELAGAGQDQDSAPTSTIVYRVGNSLYINLTNRCSCACVFCIRQNGATGPVDGDAENLWLDVEPTAYQVVKELQTWDASPADADLANPTAVEAAAGQSAPDGISEVVFCGYGEPMEAFDVLKEVAAWVHQAWGLPVRINTNGQGCLICGRDIVPELEGLIDRLSVSLNAPNAARYQEVSQSQYGEAAYAEVLDFARRSKAVVDQVVMTTVGGFLTPEEERQCAEICQELGVKYRVRVYEG